MGLLARAADSARVSLRLQPSQPVARFLLARFSRLQHQYAAALQHTQAAWHDLIAQVPQAQLLHLEVLNQLLVLLDATEQYDALPTWLATFDRLHAALETTARSAAQQQQLREEEGECALWWARYLAVAPSVVQTTDVLEQQLDSLAQAIAKGTPAIQHLALHRQAETLAHLQRLQEAAATYTSSQQERALADYRTHVRRLFTRSGVPFQVEMVQQGPDAPWLALYDVVDLDEASGNPVVTVQLCFNVNASSPEPQPGVPEVALYAQCQGEAQRVVETHGMASLPWPSLAYAGSTAFDGIFPERLALNRDLVFLAYVERRALLRYARVLRQTTGTLASLATTFDTVPAESPRQPEEADTRPRPGQRRPRTLRISQRPPRSEQRRGISDK